MMGDDSRSIRAEQEADADPRAPLCLICLKPLIPYPRALEPLIPDDPAWLCLNIAAHGNKPDTAAIWLTSEIEDAFALSDAEKDDLELVIPWKEGRS